MDNAQKAIMIGVGLFITIIIISAVLLITNLGTGLINNVQGQLSNISAAVQSQITGSYDGKTMTGNDVISAVQQYQNSNDISVRIIVDEEAAGQFQTGKYAVTLVDTDKLDAPAAGGVKVTYTGTNSYKELGDSDPKKNSLSEIQATGTGVSGTQTYYAYTMIDDDSENVVGILFVRKGLTKASIAKTI